jgi:RNA polymerase sigma-70 factor (ECF subfamily)
MEDLVQQVYLQLLSAIRSFRGDSRFTTFLHRVCANVALMHLRTRRRHPEDLTDELPEEHAGVASNPEHQAHLRQAAALLQRALDEMAPKKRIVFVYHELMGLMPEEIAEAVDTSPNTVRSRLHHARIEFTRIVARLTREAPELVVGDAEAWAPAELLRGGGNGA